MNGVSVIICTYNRRDFLEHCLRSFTGQTIQPENLEFIVVDNNSSDDTISIVKKYTGKIHSLTVVTESKIGLSHARNRGLHEAKYDWVCYMDDDAIAHKDFIERLFYVINHYSFDGFGGMFYPWYFTPKPKWLSSDFGKMTMLRSTTGELSKGKTVAGGICAFKKDLLIQVGEFPVDIGMRGNIVGYGEENYVQNKLWENGAVIGFDPSWKMDHLVADYKYTVGWHLQRHFAKGRDYQITAGKLSVMQKIKLGVRAFGMVIILFVKNFFRWIGKKNYYWQNYILDTLSYTYKLFGRISV